MARQGAATAPAEIVVGAGEDVHAVVVCSVWERRQLIKEVIAVTSPHDVDQAALGCGGNRARANVFCSGHAFAADRVSAKNLAFVTLNERYPGRTRFLLKANLDRAAIARGGRSDQLLDRAGRLSFPDNVADVEAAALRVMLEPKADGVVGVAVSACRFSPGQIPVADGAGSFGQLVWLYQLKPVAPEELAVVGDLPVALQKPLAFGEWELAQHLAVVVLVEIGVVLEPGGEIGDAGRPRCV